MTIINSSLRVIYNSNIYFIHYLMSSYNDFDFFQQVVQKYISKHIYSSTYLALKAHANQQFHILDNFIMT